jgi:hypothetical protein
MKRAVKEMPNLTGVAAMPRFLCLCAALNPEHAARRSSSFALPVACHQGHTVNNDYRRQMDETSRVSEFEP